RTLDGSTVWSLLTISMRVDHPSFPTVSAHAQHGIRALAPYSAVLLHRRPTVRRRTSGTPRVRTARPRRTWGWVARLIHDRTASPALSGEPPTAFAGDHPLTAP